MNEMFNKSELGLLKAGLMELYKKFYGIQESLNHTNINRNDTMIPNLVEQCEIILDKIDHELKQQ